MRAYAARFVPEPEGGFTVTFRDVPEAITSGEDRPEALSMATDALETAFSVYIERRMTLPPPSKARRGEVLVPLSALGAAKVALYETMQDQGIGKAELARRLNCHLPQIDRLLDLCHSSKLEQVESALAALGKRLLIDVDDAA